VQDVKSESAALAERDAKELSNDADEKLFEPRKLQTVSSASATSSVAQVRIPVPGMSLFFFSFCHIICLVP
jgi:hypothetical protein